MALEKTVTTPHGFEAVDAYHRVEDISLQSKTVMRFFLKSYRDQQASPHFDMFNFDIPYDMNDANPFVQAYRYVKKLPEFSDAVDC